MASIPIKIKINVKKLLKPHFFHAPSGSIYVDLVAFENRNGPDQYGNTHMVVQDIDKSKLPEGQRAPIVGNLKVPGGATASKPAAKPGPRNEPPPRSIEDEDEIDF